MPKGAVEVYWRHGFMECELRSTDGGWEVWLTVANGAPVRRERVTSNQVARMLAERWRQEDLAADQV